MATVIRKGIALASHSPKKDGSPAHIFMDDLPTIELPLSHGQPLDHYIIDEEIGPRRLITPTHVYRARERQTNQVVVLKVLSLKFDREYAAQRALERFIREARVMKQLSHPNILPVLAVDWNPYTYWIVMPYCAKGTLADCLVARQHRPLTVTQACKLGMQICRALECAHTQMPPIIHRDIKPHNMLFADNAQLAVMDFGIAHIMYEPHLTQFDKAVGTPEYMAPEQLQMRDDAQPEKIDPRLDIYALGCVLYELLSGHPPFTGNSPQAVGLAHLRVPPKPLSLQNSQVNMGLQHIVHRALEKDPTARYASAGEFAHALAPFVEE